MINSRKKQRGFTLIEILIVLVCLGILTASTITSYVYQAKKRVLQQKLELAINELTTATNTCLLIKDNKLDCQYDSTQSSNALTNDQYMDELPTSLTAVIQLNNDPNNGNGDDGTFTISTAQLGGATSNIIQRICTHGTMNDDGSCDLTFHVQPMGLDNAQNSQDAVMTSISNQSTPVDTTEPQ